MTGATRYRWGLGLLIGGLGVAFLSVAAYSLGVGETTTTRTSTEQAGSSSGSSAPETPEQFLAALQRAQRAGDAGFLLAHLHPAVIERYGQDACRAFVSEPADPTSTFAVVKVDHTGPWDYTSDGQTTTIADTVFVVANRVAHGQEQAQVDVHVAPVHGKQRWFTDCTPG
ncbi:MAG: hypothetical protein MUP97_11885 [Acidimicrobiia bacterium]|nr:hypothetical protein [Acidimicrobiia bacterium]